MNALSRDLPHRAGFPVTIDCPSAATAAVEWAHENRDAVLAMLERNGAVLFRGFGIGLDTLRHFVVRLSDSLEQLAEESSPRSVVAQDVFTSTDYPDAFPIQMHNEFSYSARWPMKLFFCCLQPPQSGGTTPIADCRQVLARLSPGTRRRFERHGVLYLRNYLPFMGVQWQTAFGTSNRDAVEAYCRDNGIDCSWDGDELRTRQVTAAIVEHPVTGEAVWFNHAFFFNLRAIEPVEVRESLLCQPEFSTDTCFGDGSPIDAQTIEELRAAYAASSTETLWEQGDVLMIDNMLTAHGRRPFRGARRIVVSMSDPYARISLRHADNRH